MRITEIKDLIGKTIVEAAKLGSTESDDTGWLKLSFSDGTSCVIEASYSEHTGNSWDEYPLDIGLCDYDDMSLLGEV